jgi:hypothetical protein
MVLELLGDFLSPGGEIALPHGRGSVSIARDRVYLFSES